MASTLEEFVPVEDFIKYGEAALRIFNRQDEERKNLMKARIKFTIERLGIDTFREMVKEELKGELANKRIDLDSLMWVEDEEADAPAVPGDATPEPANDAAYSAWKSTNAVPQKQSGFNLVHVRIERGDIYAEQWSQLAAVARRFAGGRVRIDQQQNVVFRWVRSESLFDMYTALSEIGLAAAGAQTIRDIVTCPGTDSCKLGITSSMGLNKALGEALDGMDLSDPDVSSLHIKASGCPNSCGQHHIANIGFHGAVMKAPGGQVPAYEMFLGGNYDDGNVRVGHRVKARVPAKKAPDALKRILAYYKESRSQGEKFNDFVDRVGVAPFEEIFGQLKEEIGPLDRDHINTYMDWGKTVLYKLERGEGECAV